MPAVCLVGGLGGEIGGEVMDMSSTPASPGDSAPLSEGESDEEATVPSASQGVAWRIFPTTDGRFASVTKLCTLIS